MTSFVYRVHPYNQTREEIVPQILDNLNNCSSSPVILKDFYNPVSYNTDN